MPAIQDILTAEGPLTRRELMERRGTRGLRLDPKSQAPIHLIGYVALLGLVCMGPDREDGEPTYVLVRDWIGEWSVPPRDRSLGELARR